MTTISAGGSSTATAAANQREAVVTSTGRRWVAFETASGLDFFYSDDEGATWAENTSATIASGTDPSFYIDKDDHAHVAYLVGGGCSYRRMASIDTATSWGAAQSTGVASPGVPVVVAHREGSGWHAHVVVSFNSGTNNLPVWVPFSIAADGTITKGTNVNINGAGHGVNAHVYPSIDFHHTGDSKTVQGSTPHLYVSWRTGSTGANHGIRYKKATYSAGSWTWGSERGLDESNDANSGLLSAAFDGSRFITAYVPSTSTTDVYVRERDAADTTTTNRTATNLAGGAITAMSMSFDDEDDIHVWAVGDTNDDIERIVYDRAGGAWDLAWTTVEATTAVAGTLSLKGGHGGSSIDAVWTVAPGTVVFATLELNQAPTTATWDLTDNQAHDVNAGLTLDWTFNDPDDGDTQGSYALRRQIGAAAYEYWNAGTTSWGASEVQNTSSSSAVTLTSSWGADGDSNHKYAVKTWDAAGLVSTYSSELTVIPSAKDNPTISSPADASTLTQATVTVEWSAATQTAYKARLLSSAGAEIESSGWVTPTATSHTFSKTLSNSTTYKVELTTRNDEGLASDPDTNSFSTSFTPPSTPTLVATGSAANGTITVDITNPGLGATESTNDVFVRVAAGGRADGDIPVGGDGLRVATGVAVDGSFTFYPAGGKAYEFLVRAHATNGTSADSAWT